MSRGDYTQWKKLDQFSPNVPVKKLNGGSNGVVAKALNSKSGGPMFKTTRWLKSRLSLSSFRGQSNECQELMVTYW